MSENDEDSRHEYRDINVSERSHGLIQGLFGMSSRNVLARCRFVAIFSGQRETSDRLASSGAIGWVEKGNQAYFEFCKELPEARLFTTLSQEIERGEFPARGLAVEVSTDQMPQDALGTALVMIVDGGELLGRLTWVEAELSPDLREKRPLLIVARLEPGQDPALALGVGEADDDPIAER